MFNSRFGKGVLKHPGYNIGGGIGEAALIGAAFGGAKAIATGDDPLEAALLGGITGGAMSGVTGALLGNAGSTAANTAATEGAKEATAMAAQEGAKQAAMQSANMLTPQMAEVGMANTFNTATNELLPAAAETANAGLTGLNNAANQMVGQNAVSSGIQGGIPDVAQLARNAELAQTAGGGGGGIQEILNRAGPDLRNTSIAPEGSMIRKGLNWWENQGELGRPLIAGAAGYGMGALEPKPLPKPKEEEKSKLHGYDPEHFTPYIPETPDPYYRASYAEGGIAALADGGMGGNQMYPQGMQDHTQYATPSQMPTSAEVVNTGYEMQTDPYMGTPVGMAQGGVARYFDGGSLGMGASNNNQVYYDPEKGKYYTMGNGFTNTMVTGIPTGAINAMGGKFGGEGDRQYIGGGGSGGKFGSGTGASASEQIKPDVYKASYESPLAEHNPNPISTAVTAAAVTSPEYDAMMRGVAPQDFNRVFNQITSQNTQAAQPQAVVPVPVPVPVPATEENKNMAQGGIAGFNLGGYASGGNPRLLKGPGDGMSDNIPATIGDRQPARLADGEFVVPADVVSHLGNGSTDAGAKHLYAMMDKVRTARTGKKSQGKQIKPEKYLPA